MSETKPKAERNEKGQWVAGHKSTGGRLPRARELARLAVMQEKCTLETWGRIIEKAIRDALGVRLVQTASGPRIEDDPDSDGATRERGRRFIAEYTIGKPSQNVTFGDADLLAILDGCTSTDIAEIFELAEGIIRRGEVNAGSPDNQVADGQNGQVAAIAAADQPSGDGGAV